MRISKTYREFLLNEARISISDELKDVLDTMSQNAPEGTNWAERLRSLVDTEVETNINFLSTSENPDMIKWRADDKATKTYTIWMPQRYYKNATESIGGRQPEGQNTARLIRRLTIEEAAKALKGDFKALNDARFEYAEGHSILQLAFKDRKGEGQCLISEKWCKPTPYKATAQDFRVGKVFRSLMNAAGYEPTNQEVDNFHTEYANTIKSIKKSENDRFEIVEGEDIRQYYLQTSYEALKHTLGTSCMRHPKCQPYFDIYVQNPRQIKLLILRSRKDPSRISGRAILWYDLNAREGDDFEYKWGMKDWDTKANFMDRIFVTNSKDERLFKSWAIDNGFLFKTGQDHTPYPISKDLKTKSTMTLWVKLENGTPKSGLFPYMDTLCHYQPENGVLTNIDQDWGDFDWWQLRETNGGNGQCLSCGGTGQAECAECLGEGTTEDMDGNEVECPLCGGTGGVACVTCGGV